MIRWLALILVAPLAMAGIVVDQGATINSTSQEAFATLAQADQGAAVIGTSATQADITVAAATILIEDDILDIASTDDTWSVQAIYRDHTGVTGTLTVLTLSLNDGILSPTQIIIANGIATQTQGLEVDLPTTGATELRAIATAGTTGTVELDLVLTRDAGSGPTLVYPVTIII